MKPISEKNYYELLEVPVNASSEAIEAAYERALRELGPDSIVTYTLVSPEEAKALLSRIEDAYLTLTDPALRAEYDASVLSPDLRQLPRAEPEPRAQVIELVRQEPVAEAPAPAQQLVLAPVLESPAVESWPARLDAPVLGRADVGVVPDAPREIVLAPEREETEAQASEAVTPAAEPTAPTSSEAAPASDAPEAETHAEEALVETDKVGVLAAAQVEETDGAEAAGDASAEELSDAADEPAVEAAVEPEEAREAAPAQVEAQPVESAPTEATPEPDSIDDGEVEAVEAEAQSEPEARVEAAPPPAPSLVSAAPTPPAAAVGALAVPPLPAKPAPQAPLLEPIPAPKEERREPPRALPRMPEIGANTVINGELLRAAREGRGVTLRELSDKTKIGVNHLENIEADRYSALPVAVYLRGFLMSVARELKLDPLRISKGYLETLAQAKGRQGS